MKIFVFFFIFIALSIQQEGQKEDERFKSFKIDTIKAKTVIGQWQMKDYSVQILNINIILKIWVLTVVMNPNF